MKTKYKTIAFKLNLEREWPIVEKIMKSTGLNQTDTIKLLFMKADEELKKTGTIKASITGMRI